METQICYTTINEIITYENFIVQAKQQKQAQSLELTQQISVIIKSYNTSIPQKQQRIYEIIKQNRGNHLKQKT